MNHSHDVDLRLPDEVEHGHWKTPHASNTATTAVVTGSVAVTP
ncbi:MAG TPA: hypothetical protein VKA43_17990 [Gammaproteobacteria bacterium]|nr:hypothetical protein [Gammaproteobacteria bacterium]